MRIEFIHFSKCSGALQIPKASLLKQYRPYGVMNVVSSRESFASGIRQNPLLASSFENTWAPVSWARVSSTLGRGWASYVTFSFSGFKSTHLNRPIYYCACTLCCGFLHFRYYFYGFHSLELLVFSAQTEHVVLRWVLTWWSMAHPSFLGLWILLESYLWL